MVYTLKWRHYATRRGVTGVGGGVLDATEVRGVYFVSRQSMN